MRLSEAHRKLLVALAQGNVLKAHRDMHGAKVYKLHSLHGAPVEVIQAPTVDYLRKHRLIDSNMKFPAAVYLLTDKGAAVATRLTGTDTSSIGPRNYYL